MKVRLRFVGVVRVFLAIALIVVLQPTARGQGDRGGASLARLKTGNARFVADAAEALPITAPRRAALAQGQSPFASVLSCADSRVPPEVIFHTGLGDLFVVRAAGHVADKSVLASLEYGAEHLHTPLLVVMGHESCGAVKAAVETPATKSMGPNLDYLLQSIRPAVARTAGQPAETRLRAAILAHVEETINQLLDSSAALKEMAEAQQLTLVGGYYELASGRVHFSEPVRVIPRRTPARTTTSASPAHAPAAAARASTGPAATAASGASAAAPSAKPPVSGPAAAAKPAPEEKPATTAPKAAAPAHTPVPAKASGH